MRMCTPFFIWGLPVLVRALSRERFVLRASCFVLRASLRETAPGVRPGGRPTFFAGSKKVGKERASNIHTSQAGWRSGRAPAHAVCPDRAVARLAATIWALPRHPLAFRCGRPGSPSGLRSHAPSSGQRVHWCAWKSGELRSPLLSDEAGLRARGESWRPSAGSPQAQRLFPRGIGLRTRKTRGRHHPPSASSNSLSISICWRDCCSEGPLMRKVSSTRSPSVITFASCRLMSWRARTRAMQ